jgi:hypothetical protein
MTITTNARIAGAVAVWLLTRGVSSARAQAA